MRHILIITVTCLILTNGSAQSASELLDSMLKAMETVESISFNLKSKERITGNFVEKSIYFKINEEDSKIYMKDLLNGTEIIYVKGWNNNKMYINTGGFPYFNISMSPLANRVRKNQHRTIHEAGFRYIGRVFRKVKNTILNTGQTVKDYFNIVGSTQWKGRDCYKLYITPPDFKYVNYELTTDETPREIAKRLNLTEFMIIEKNGLSGYGKVKAGTTIQIPNYYAKKIVFYVDKQSYLPIVQFLYDEKGLLERYEFHDLDLNPTFTDSDFSSENPDYGF